MNQNVSSLERAFELAKSGVCVSVDDIRARLRREGYSSDQVSGPSLRKQLMALINEANKAGQGSDHTAS